MSTQYISYSSRNGGGVATYPTFTAFPASAPDGTLAVALDTDVLYVFNAGSSTWLPIGAPGSVLSIGPIDSQAPGANGATINVDAIIMQSASASFPGLVNNTTQSFSGNKTFTGTISASNLSGTNSGDVTLGTADGLSLAGQVLSLQLSDATHTGALSSADWNTFNSKQAALTIGNLTDVGTDGIIITGGTGAVIGSGTSIAQHVADATHNGYLSSTDWSTFNAKQPAGSYALTSLSNLAATAVNADIIPAVDDVTNLGSSAIAYNQVFAYSVASNASTNVVNLANGNLNSSGGALSVDWVNRDLVDNAAHISVDWQARNLKDTSASNQLHWSTSGVSFPLLTASTVPFLNASNVLTSSAVTPTELGYVSGVTSSIQTQLNGKQASGNYITALTGDGTASGPGSAAFTLATVNGNVGSFGTASSVSAFTVNAKGLITAAGNTSIQIAESQVTNLVSDLAGKQPTGNYITALTGDVVAAGPGSAASTIQANVVTNSKLAQIPAHSYKGNNTGSTANAADITSTQVTADLNLFTSSLQGLVPASGGGTANFLRADGTFAAPPGATSGTVTSVALADSTGLFNITGSPVTSSGTLTLASFQSQAQNTFFAAPTGSAGAPVFRLISAVDVPTLNQNTTGTASNVTGIVAIANGGTGQSSKASAFDALSPMTTGGDIIYGGASGTGTRLANGSSGQFLTSGGGTAAPTWTTGTTGTVTSVAATVPSVFSISGSPITTSGTLAITYSGTALPIANGGTAGTNKDSAFNNLSPITTLGDIIVGAAAGDNSRLPIGSNGNLLTVVAGVPAWAAPATNGTVTSVALTVPSFLSVSGSPITSSGTLAVTLSTETANTVFAGPASGGAATPTFRALTVADQTIAAQAVSASAIDWSTGNMFTKTLGANTTFTFSNNISGQTIIVRLTNTASNYTVTWPTVRWAGGTPPTMSTGAVSDVYTFIYDGSNFYGSAVQSMT